jgi:crotonobetainyl-CoA:carnitine CoA-transferase CaiB-like acyl-CoA transferase
MTADNGRPLPLSGVRVLDIGRRIAGPFCARLLARLGADVVKIEQPGAGDPARRIGPFRAGAARGESGPLHLYVNEGKRGVTLDLASATGRDLFLRLVAQSQVVVENFEPRVMASLGLAYEVLRDAQPGVVATSISNFGESGPYRDYQASELTMFAMGGHVYHSGEAGRPPLRMGGAPAQYMAAIASAYGTMLALRVAEETGAGQHVDFSMLESQVTSHAQAMVEVSYYGAETVAGIPRSAAGGIRGVVTKDGPAMLSAQEQQTKSLAALVGAPEELGRPNPMDRGAGRVELMRHVARWAEDRSKREVYELGQGAHVPASFVANPADLVESPQYQHRGFIREVEHAESGTVQIPDLPFQWDGAWSDASPAPLVGQHNAEVYDELLGVSKEELVQLAGAGVI